MSDPAVLIEAVTFDYPRGPRALDGIDLRVETGERLAIVGQNGSGKSTLVRHLNGLLRPTVGSVAINGRPIGRRHVAELAREVGLAFQNPDRQIFASRVRREVEFGPKNLGRLVSARSKKHDEPAAEGATESGEKPQGRGKKGHVPPGQAKKAARR